METLRFLNKQNNLNERKNFSFGGKSKLISTDN